MKFVTGKEGSLKVSDRAFFQPEMRTTDGKLLKATIRGVKGANYAFTIKRGVAEEWNDNSAWGGDGRHVYARILPEDAEPELAALDAQIAAAEAELQKIRKERQAFLAANIVRGERITVKAIQALPPPPPPPPPDPEQAARLRRETARMQGFVDTLFGQKR